MYAGGRKNRFASAPEQEVAGSRLVESAESQQKERAKFPEPLRDHGVALHRSSWPFPRTTIGTYGAGYVMRNGDRCVAETRFRREPGA
jgi:hypothetical protein